MSMVFRVPFGVMGCLAVGLASGGCRPGVDRDDIGVDTVDDTVVDTVDSDEALIPHENIAPDIQAPFGEPMPWVTGELLDGFYRGKAVFTRNYKVSEGAGPDFITTSCVGCHERPTVGGSATLYRNSFVAGQRADNAYVIADGENIPIDSLNGALVRYYRVGDPDGLARGPIPQPGVDLFSSVNAIPLYGVGLFVQVPDASITPRLDPDDLDGDGVSARNFENQYGIGRIGFKAEGVGLQEITTSSFNLLSQLTIQTLSEHERNMLPFGDVGDPRMTEHDTDAVSEPEIPTSDLFDVILYIQLLAAPEFDPMTEREAEGRDLFAAVGCAVCHAPRLESPRGPIPAYSDLLLHDMGPESGDGIALTFGNTGPYELRTQPLWGVAAAGPYLRDGRALTIHDAILGHGGEGSGARDAYASLTADEQDQIVSFLRTLGGRDYGLNNRIHPGAPPPPAGEQGGPIPGLSEDDAAVFERGRLLFDRMFGLKEGLGSPYFNGDACSSCHFAPEVGGGGPMDVNVIRQGRLNVDGTFAPSPMGNMVPKQLLIDTTPFGTDPDAQIVEHRQTPHNFGLGAIETVADATIAAAADPDDADGDGISGRAAWLPNGRLGRFGWKASADSVLDFICGAFGVEMGLTSSEQECGDYGVRTDSDAVPDPELTDEIISSVAAYVRLLAPPPRGPSSAAVVRGEAGFAAMGCAACHTPALEGELGPVPCYSDLLLHDVAPAPFRGIEEGVASMNEYRTPPLWGLLASAPYLHHGEADTLEDAIAGHAGEATASRAAFSAATPQERADVIAFLHSL